MRYDKLFLPRVLVCCLWLAFGLWPAGNGIASAEDKFWSGLGDGISWEDDDNWIPSVTPAALDDVVIDFPDASIVCGQTYKAKSVTIGGANTSLLTSDNFIFGTIDPGSSSEAAVTTRSGGAFVLKGSSGTVTLYGQYRSTKDTPAPEPGFMFWVN